MTLEEIKLIIDVLIHSHPRDVTSKGNVERHRKAYVIAFNEFNRMVTESAKEVSKV